MHKNVSQESSQDCVTLVCRQGRLNWDNPLDESTKTEASCHSRCGMIKTSRGQNKEQRPHFCSPSPTIMTSQYERNILERNVKQQRKKERKTNKDKQTKTYKIACFKYEKKNYTLNDGFLFLFNYLLFSFLFISERQITGKVLQNVAQVSVLLP